MGAQPVDVVKPPTLKSTAAAARKAAQPCYLGQQAAQENRPQPSAQEWNTLAEQQDPQAQAVLARYYRRLAKALAGVINLTDPHVIVLRAVAIPLRHLSGSPKLWAEYVFSDSVSTHFWKQALHGDSSGVRGAARLGAAACWIGTVSKQTTARKPSASK